MGFGAESRGQTFLHRPHSLRPYLKNTLESLILSKSLRLLLSDPSEYTPLVTELLGSFPIVGICSGQELQGGEGAVSECSSESRDPGENPSPVAEQWANLSGNFSLLFLTTVLQK